MYYRRYNRPKNVSSPELEERLFHFGGEISSHLTDWERDFVESITESYKKYKGLTPRQLEIFVKIEGKYCDAALSEKKAWTDSFDEEKRKTLKTVVDYYRNIGYFSSLVAKIDSDPDFVPDEGVWKKFTENKYAKKVLAVENTESKFIPGGFALMRDTFTPGNVGFWGKSRDAGYTMAARVGRPVLTLKRSDRVSTDKVWTVAFLDNPVAMFEVEERWLKKYRKPKKV
jgi:hypothetical protein